MAVGVTSIGRATLTNGIIDFLNRVGAPAFIGPLTNKTPADAWNAFLGQQLGLNDPQGGVRNREVVFLCSRINNLTGQNPPVGATLYDLWNQYLQVKGHTGTLNDKFAQWLDHGSI